MSRERASTIRVNQFLCHAALAVAIASCLPVPAAQAQAATQESAVRYNIPVGDLATALDRFSTQSGIQLLYRPELVADRVTRGVSGRYTSAEALRRLLDGSGLESNLVDATTYVLRSSAASPAGGAGSSLRKNSTNEDQGEEETQDLPAVMVHRPFTDANVDIVRTEKDVQPYYIFSGEEIANANAVTVEEYLKQRLTMNSVSQTGSQLRDEPASRVNLRGLGTNQTLILVNGRRTGGSNDDAQFDLNALSPSQIERIEVLPSSASAIYGGNAIGGVLNIILKRDFTGGDISLTYDTPLDTDAPVRSVSAGYGWGLEQGRTHVTLRATYRDGRDVLRYGERRELLERGFSRMLSRVPELVYGPGNPYGYGTTPNIGSVDGEPLVFKDGGPLGDTSLGSALTYIPVGTSPDISLADLQTTLLANAGRQNTSFPQIVGGAYWVRGLNTGLLTPWEAPTEAYSMMGAVRRRMTDRLELVAEAYYSRNVGTKLPRATNTYFYVPASSPANPFQQDVYVPSPVAGATGWSVIERENLRTVAGFVLDLPGNWRAQGDYTWGRSPYAGRYTCFDCASGGQALPLALADGTLNPFVDTLAHPLDLSLYQQMTGEGQTSVLNDTGLRLSGPVGTLPAGRPNLTVGLGHREEKVSSGFSDQAAYGRYSYFPQSQSVSSVYAEALIPLLRNLPGARLLELQIASRLEDFSVNANGYAAAVTCPSGGTSCIPTPEAYVPEYSRSTYTAITETLGLRYQPLDSVTLRASYATGFLPPSLWELYPSSDPQFYEWGPDPLRGGEQVRARYLSGGNPDLDPMNSKSFNLGLIFEPTFWGLEGLRAGIEWFRIDRKNLVWYPQSSFLLANQERFSDRIVRSDPEPADLYGVGPITLLDLRALNANEVSTEGVDINVAYRRSTERRGVFTLDLLATIVNSYSVALDIDYVEEAVGRVNEWDAPLKLRANATVGWERGPWSLSWTALYYGQYEQVPLSWGPYIEAQGRTTVPHQIYHNLLASYRFADREESGLSALLSDLTVTLGVRNVLDTLPPLDAFRGGTGAYSFFGDPRLRSVQLSVRKAFN